MGRRGELRHSGAKRRRVELLRAQSLRVETGEFGADMQVSSVNDGPMTLLLEI